MHPALRNHKTPYLIFSPAFPYVLTSRATFGEKASTTSSAGGKPWIILLLRVLTSHCC